MSKQDEINEQKDLMKDWSRSQLHARSLSLSEHYMKSYPDTWKEKIKTNRELEAIKQLLK